MTVRDGIEYTSMPESAVAAGGRVTTIKAGEGESKKDVAMRLLDHIHDEARRQRAKAVWIGELKFLEGTRSPTTTVMYMR